MVSGNAQQGIALAGGMAMGNATCSNAMNGIENLLGSPDLMSNSSASNGGAGIVFDAGMAIGNAVSNNAGVGLQIGINGAYKNNVITNNNGGAAAETSGGIEMVPNVCGVDLNCPGP